VKILNNLQNHCFEKDLNPNYIFFILNILRWYKVNCSELKKDQRLSCEGCGFELKVVNACGDDSCSTKACCNGDIKCCGEPMKLKWYSK
jgi:hypothetical protein